MAQPAATVGDRPALAAAIESFIDDNTVFESTVPVEEALVAIRAAKSLTEAFRAPLQSQLFDMRGALLWTLFMSTAPALGAEEGDAPFEEGDAFVAAEALALVATVYDRGVDAAVGAHFDDEESLASDESVDTGTESEEEPLA